MGTTLTHNVYLPDEGERNCYSGLAQNWQILDDAVGAIAGKANASHTHGNITNAGAIGSTSGLPIITGTDGVLTTGTFGNTAGTFCEGNDSRLSDARTPVAHTHSKTDITDLFNSANTWTANQTFKGNIQQYFDAASNTTPATNQFNVYNTVGSNSGVIISQQTANRTTGQRDVSTRVYATDNTFNGYQLVKDANNNYSFSPIYTNTVALGTSTLQWKSVSSQTYYYNGTQWGLDVANTWTAENSFNHANLNRKYNFTLGDNSYLVSRVQYRDTNNTRWGVFTFVHDTDNSVYCDIGVTCLKNDGQTTLNKAIRLLVQPDNVSEFRPLNNSAINLGTSSYKWKTLNGVNPGALGFPNMSQSSDVKPFITNVSGSASANLYTPAVDGWIVVKATAGASYSIYMYDRTIGDEGMCASGYGNGSQGSGRLAVSMPVIAGHVIGIICVLGSTSDIRSALFFPNLGNA